MAADLPDLRGHITDPRTLRALAHPLRMDLLEAVTVHGPLTATRAAELVGESPANCSWHLRQLAKHGFIEPAPGSHGRERPYQRTEAQMAWTNSDPTADPAFIAAADTLQSAFLAREFVNIQRASAQPAVPGWETAGVISTMITWLTAEELTQVSQAIFAALAVHRDRLENPALRPPDARPVRLMGIAVTDDALDFVPSADADDAADIADDTRDADAVRPVRSARKRR